MCVTILPLKGLAVFSFTRASLRRRHRFLSWWLRVEPSPPVNPLPPRTPDFSVPIHRLTMNLYTNPPIDFRLSTVSAPWLTLQLYPYKVKRRTFLLFQELSPL